ncbi:hypothetical protein [Demequina sp.]|uniref:hypothetical protein n=1 Tax=Demequina sp. TaxID=2050685 RepID=UPI0025B7F38E|nr:hypothetical protein [Demequina sp.]
MAMRTWSERRLRVWRWGWGALLAGVLFAPIGQQGSCAETAASVAGDSQCESRSIPLLGLILPISYPAP